MKCPRWLPRAIIPLYRLRGRIVDRKFAGSVTRPETWLRFRVLEPVIDWVEMWEARPGFERMAQMAAEMEDIAARIEKIRKDVGI